MLEHATCIIEILHRAQMGHDVYTEYVRITSVGLAALAPMKIPPLNSLVWGSLRLAPVTKSMLFQLNVVHKDATAS